MPGYDRTVPPGHTGTAIVLNAEMSKLQSAAEAHAVWTFTEDHVGRFCPEVEGAASRRDDTDRSLARSAWKSVPRKNRPVGYGVIGAANPRGISRRNGCRVS